MQSRADWADTLKQLRQNGEVILLQAVSNLQTTFTHDTVTLIAPNKSVHDLLTKNREKLGGAIIKLKQSETREITTEQKLKNMFGDKIKIEN